MWATSPTFAVLGFVPSTDRGNVLFARCLDLSGIPADLEIQTPCPKRQTLDKSLAAPVSVGSCVSD